MIFSDLISSYLRKVNKERGSVPSLFNVHGGDVDIEFGVIHEGNVSRIHTGHKLAAIIAKKVGAQKVLFVSSDIANDTDGNPVICAHAQDQHCEELYIYDSDSANDDFNSVISWSALSLGNGVSLLPAVSGVLANANKYFADMLSKEDVEHELLDSLSEQLIAKAKRRKSSL